MFHDVPIVFFSTLFFCYLESHTVVDVTLCHVKIFPVGEVESDTKKCSRKI